MVAVVGGAVAVVGGTVDATVVDAAGTVVVVDVGELVVEGSGGVVSGGVVSGSVVSGGVVSWLRGVGWRGVWLRRVGG